jgi:uncharacterized protein YbjT (DUF2867 family)
LTRTVGIVGATGNVGRRLVQRLANEQVGVRALTRDAVRARLLLPELVDVVEISTANASQLDRGFDGCSAVFLACGNGPRQAEFEQAVVQAAARRQVGRIVKLSSIVAALDPGSLHRQVEEAIERTGIAYTHLRPSTFMQSLLTLAEPGIVGEDELRLPVGDASIDAIDVRDIADAACLALSAADDRPDVQALLGQRQPLTAVASDISRACGRTVTYVDVPPEQARREWLQAGLAPSLAAMLTGIFASLRTMDPIRARSDVQRGTGHPPRTWRDAADGVGGEDRHWRDVNLAAGESYAVELA